MTEETKVEYLKKYIDGLIRPILAYPDSLTIDSKVDEMGVLYTIKAKKEDFGRMIGKEGETIGAVRKLSRAVGMTKGIRASIMIPEIE